RHGAGDGGGAVQVEGCAAAIETDRLENLSHDDSRGLVFIEEDGAVFVSSQMNPTPWFSATAFCFEPDESYPSFSATATRRAPFTGLFAERVGPPVEGGLLRELNTLSKPAIA